MFSPSQFRIYDHLFISVAHLRVRTSSDAQKTAQKQQINTQTSDYTLQTWLRHSGHNLK